MNRPNSTLSHQTQRKQLLVEHKVNLLDTFVFAGEQAWAMGCCNRHRVAIPSRQHCPKQFAVDSACFKGDVSEVIEYQHGELFQARLDTCTPFLFGLLYQYLLFSDEYITLGVDMLATPLELRIDG